MSDDEIIRISVPPATGARKKPPALGRGLGALLGDSRREEPLVNPAAVTAPGGSAAPREGLAMLAVADIVPHPDQPRRHFDEAALDELAASIGQRGLIQPVIVTPYGAGRWRLVAGERRWRAAQRAQIHEIPAIVRDLDEREVTALALIENLQREDLNPIEEARAYHRLAENDGLTQAEIARLVDKSRSHVANLQRLLSLPDSVVELVEAGKLSMGHARALVGVEDAATLAEQAVSKQLSVREVERLARRKTTGTSAPRRARSERDSASSADIAAVQSHLEEFLGLSVRINTDADPRSGAVTIRYRTLDQLDLICQRLTGGGI
ncbi:ParB/RepB/Spo0J family partition protein [Novosphingobium sp.]|uniref:ParB/RepB/Spo0J family partition protein n=1 Tax=Novosphingobium sp. TaxID=1874826 RepID=UPI0022CC28CE|nr:ParB/RepB/Spo0J family partition protein [Novosphingobium sp.]MCZ8018939.1 ParB/RepB/Spo0J family partition protein [Novosphingobium sp.]MCZ8034545.1 ParB/RepB/Spo0J family partition protein [Novosphingobium sp.]MCZ8052093.1 ParB/RepB/Spo0J family partition protein [Novosphingobium sp.]MCZ8060019.1 ParB/RepB/Spo0J family partition protein [Novosphingobium sp.]MCZ8230981.1 ParB/RepB/Spo0J family partition protein [Novosphingobium sp.]